MSFVKNQLKLARDALGKKDYVAAKKAANQVLDYEGDNYTAHVFLALSLLELGEFDESERIYRKAVELNPDQPLAYQGLSKFYERREHWDRYAESLMSLIDLYARLDDAVKCGEALQKFIDLRRSRGSKFELVEALSLLLPESSIHDVLLSLPPPDPTNPTSTTTFSIQFALQNSLNTLEEIVNLVEAEEEQTLHREVEKRRMRLGAAGPEQLKKEVGKEIWSKSRLPTLYTEILNHPNTSDELRREIDSKLLRFKYRLLHSIPGSVSTDSYKAKTYGELEELVNGAVLLQSRDELAWIIFLENVDSEDIAGYNYRIMKQFIHLFSTSSMASLLKVHLQYIGVLTNEGNDSDEPLVIVDEDPLDVILDVYPAVSDVLLANRILAQLHLDDGDFENAIKISNNALSILAKSEDNNGRELPSTRVGIQAVLATSLVHLFPPKHHTRALAIIDEVLQTSPNNVICIMGRAYILQGAKKWDEAAPLFEKVAITLTDDNLELGLRAKEEYAWCRYQLGDVDNGLAGLKTVCNTWETLDDREFDHARCLWRIGMCYWDIDGHGPEDAYTFFIRSLKINPGYAPAFTSLGLYYLEHSTPPDPTRASKCFQKAFELDPREVIAAQRLAEGFANDREWDLVEVVSRRTIEGEGGLDGGLKSDSVGSSTRYLPTNAWAWKAVGAVESNRRNYTAAIQAFQIALRAEPEDRISWLRLGEAYSNSGKHAAAVKALGRAHELNPEDWLCLFLIGGVKYRMGQFEDAVAVFESILRQRPSETGVLASLAQTHMELGRKELTDGFQMRAENSLVQAIGVGLNMVEQSHGFRSLAWKIIADSTFVLSRRSTFTNRERICRTLMSVVSFLTPSMDDTIREIISVPNLASKTLSGSMVLEIAVLAYDYRLKLASTSQASVGSAWFDTGISLHCWASAQQSDGADKAKIKAVHCLNQALRDEPGNDIFWASLGNVHFSFNAPAAQHAYIKALEIDSKNVTTWSNLGLLYLHHGDLELANETFYRAQVLDPDSALAWVGQALVALANKHDTDAMVLLEHAIGLSSPIAGADYVFASRAFTEYKSNKLHKTATFDSLLPTFFVLDRYCTQRPADAAGLHLLGLVCESLGHLDFGQKLVKQAISILETAYEETEDVTVEKNYTIANSTLGRINLSLGDFVGAIEIFESVLGLLTDSGDDETTITLRVEAYFSTGLAYFMQQDLKAALDMLQAALNAAADTTTLKGHIIVLLSQTMWAIGTEEFKEMAKTHLLECITTDVENLTAINTLAGMGILTDDDNLVDAALSEMLNLPIEQRREMDPDGNVDYLLMQHHFKQGDIDKALATAQHCVFTEPSSNDERNKLASLMLQLGRPQVTTALLSGSPHAPDVRATIPSLNVSAVAVSLEDAVTDQPSTRIALHHAQRAVMLAPYKLQHWQTLAYVKSRKE
ncbi:superkiller protein 3 [Crucibulum laeve]|uniref:Superkiller protein 3 n=1 Tax=Crucibulum laeve TaxID=68775 RepID=A0A5C3MHB0_9AGAR|nr:superkiller protein 3 [Crucibulum laeve]